jgi:hypothetical protein
MTMNIDGPFVHITSWKPDMMLQDTTVATQDIARATTYLTVHSTTQRKRPMEFLSFPSIEGLHNVVKAIAEYPYLVSGPVKYRGKVKLHGTNAGVRIYGSEVVAQSRTQLVTPENDNAGFARWVATKKDFFKKIGTHPNYPRYERDPASIAYVICRRGAVPDQIVEGEEMGENYTVFGEWCGPGIMKGTAINGIPKRVFAIFAVMIGDSLETAKMVTSPDEIKKLLGELPDDVHILPWEGEEYVIDYTDREGLQKTADAINAVIAQIEPADPWVKATFGVDGIAEGIVYVPGAGESITRKQYSDLAFKAKGEKHKVVKTKESVQIDPEVAASVQEFATMFATEARFEQGVAALGGTVEMKQIGGFLKWVSQDVIKESADELEASDLEWSQVEKSIQHAARNWYIVKAKTI